MHCLLPRPWNSAAKFKAAHLLKPHEVGNADSFKSFKESPQLNVSFITFRDASVCVRGRSVYLWMSDMLPKLFQLVWCGFFTLNAENPKRKGNKCLYNFCTNSWQDKIRMQCDIINCVILNFHF